MNNQKKLLLTINVITYNHEKWIAECLDSLLMQKTEFGFIIRIFDDASTDKTPEICRSYAEKYPEKIFLHLSPVNLGKVNNTFANAVRSYDNITTPYYLFIEGDDFRLTETGLQKQVEILEQHPECAFCMGKSINLMSGDYCFPHPNLKEGLYTKDDVLQHPEKLYLSNLGSRIVRTCCIKIDPEYPKAYTHDITQFYELLEQGSFYFLAQNIFCYRQTESGLSWGDSYFSKMQRILSALVAYESYKNDVWDLNFQKIYSVEANAVFQQNMKKFIKANLLEEVELSRLSNMKKVKPFKQFLHKIFPTVCFTFIRRLRDSLRVLRGTKKAV